MPRTLASLGATFLAGCLNTVTIAASPDASGPITSVDAEAPHDEASIGDRGEVSPSMCPATRCPAGEQCCLTTGRCFEPLLSADACPPPPQDARSERTCASNAHCAAGQLCVSDGALCLGPGHCFSRNNCGTCQSSTPGRCTVCGCDGVNYPDIQGSCLAGVRSVGSADGACGARPPVPDATARIPCATDTHCPSGQSCCAITGVCFDPGCPACCRQPPAGTRFPCVTNAQCRTGEYCRSEGCDTPGGCVSIPSTSRCSGVVEQVCGCDGRTYVSGCWAASGGTRVAHMGACP